ncbi:uncharacterized protein LOC132639908 [Lycium barbarum]|uniref:uncharacterized protein LOC132639908 n=1 Tax=Lycium barbarum TaxID=112863 RepID=UPI00293EECB1|nr:uncharacterized protein LOC132639908 [Lycium barbarum]
MDFLRFAGEDLSSWLFKIEQFFEMENVPGHEKVNVAALQLEGESIQWHLSFMRYRKYLQPATWNDYIMAMVERFGTYFDDPMEEIKKVKQVGSVVEYQAIFERNLARVTLSHENAISCFIGGLKPELNIAVKRAEPITLTQAYKSARMEEAYLAAVIKSSFPAMSSSNVENSSRRFNDQRGQYNKPILPTPNRGGQPTQRGFNRRTLTPEEMNEKRAQGLCFFCNEKYVPGHKCRNLKQLYLLEFEEEDKCCEQESPTEEADQAIEKIQEKLDISMHALNGSLGYKTLRVTGYHSKKPLHILVDRRSSHNFIDPSLVEQLGCPVVQTISQPVATGNGSIPVDKMCRISWLLQEAEFSAEFLVLPLGNCRVVLGVQWLLTLDDIKMNFRNLTMEFMYKGKKHVLRGAGKQILNTGAWKLAKISSGNHTQLYMLQLVSNLNEERQWYSLETKNTSVTDPALASLLLEFKELFVEPTTLPPSRGVFDHRVVLQAGTEPINKRPYKYPSVKKDVIESLVNQMLKQGIIQPSYSPFAAPVVLVGKKDGTWRLCVKQSYCEEQISYSNSRRFVR